jgi:hypothetical protein
MHTILSGLNKTKYVPPSQRNSPLAKKAVEKTVERVIVKKSPEFSLNDTSLFPTLEVSNANNKSAKRNVMSFAAAAKYEEPKKEVIISEYKPGWVYIRKNKGIIEYKYIPQDDKTMMEHLKNQLKYEETQDLRSLKSLLARLQWEQDKQNITLGDLSPFHNSISIEERLYEDYMYDSENADTNITLDYDTNLSDSENNTSLPENK